MSIYTKKDVCAVQVFYNGNERSIESAKNLTTCVDKVLIIDNGSEMDSKKLLFEIHDYPNLEIIVNENNMGIAYALNQALKYSEINKYKLLLTMDQDSELQSWDIDKLIDAISVDEGIISVGPFYGQTECYNSADLFSTYLITSGNLIHVESVKKIGGYTDELFIDCVDIDLSFNILANGFKMMKVKDTSMKHKIGEMENSKIFKINYLSHSPIRFYYKFRNNIYIYKKYFKVMPRLCLKLFVSLILEFFKLIFLENKKLEKLNYVKKGIKDAYDEKYGRY